MKYSLHATQRNTTKKATALSLVVAATLVLTGCAGGSVTGNADEGGKTTITMWNPATGAAAQKMNEMVDEFNQSQDKYTVQPQFIAATGFTARLVNALTNNQSPNFVMSDTSPSTLGESIATGKVVPLDDLLSTGDNPLDKSVIPEGMMAASTYDGKLYSLPTDGGDYAVIYNKKMFAEAGITKTPQTWAEVATAAKALTKDKQHGIYLPIGSNEWPVFTYQSMLWSSGGEFLNKGNTKVEFNSPEGVKALTTWTDMVRSGVAYPSSMADSNQNQGWPGFNAGKYAMFIGGAYNLQAVQDGIGKENVGVFTFPKIEKPAMNIGTNVSYILKGTDAQQAGSWAFLSWFINPEQQAHWDIASGYLPTNSKTVDSPTYKKYLDENPSVKVFVDELSYAGTRPSISNYAEISSALGKQLEKAMLGQITPEDALRLAAEDGQRILDKN